MRPPRPDGSSARPGAGSRRGLLRPERLRWRRRRVVGAWRVSSLRGARLRLALTWGPRRPIHDAPCQLERLGRLCGGLLGEGAGLGGTPSRCRGRGRRGRGAGQGRPPARWLDHGLSGRPRSPAAPGDQRGPGRTRAARQAGKDESPPTCELLPAGLPKRSRQQRSREHETPGFRPRARAVGAGCLSAEIHSCAHAKRPDVVRHKGLGRAFYAGAEISLGSAQARRHGRILFSDPWLAGSGGQLQRSQRVSAGSGSIGPSGPRSSKWRWHGVERALPVWPTLPMRSAVRTRSPVATRGLSRRCE